MRSFCYNTFREGTYNKLTGGSCHAESLDEAATQAIKINKLSVETTGEPGYERHRFIRPDGKYVTLMLFVNPEH